MVESKDWIIFVDYGLSVPKQRILSTFLYFLFFLLPVEVANQQAQFFYTICSDCQRDLDWQAKNLFDLIVETSIGSNQNSAF